ncbi:MAG: hypothetical protein V3R87_02945 [Dehalococcoidia bacterium]
MRSRLRTAALIVCVAAMVASAISGVGYVQQRSTNDALATELTAARQSLSDKSSQSEQQAAEQARRMQQRLSAAEAEVEEAKAALAGARSTFEQAYSPTKLSTGGILRGIFELASESRVDVVSVTTETQEDENRGDQTLGRLSIEMRVAGRLASIAAFVNELEEGSVKAVNINDISITGEGNLYTANLELSVLYPQL